MKTQNESEKIFERYLDLNGFKGRWTHEPQILGKSKKPDYLLDHNDQKFFFEVKELRKKGNEPTKFPAHIDPYMSLRNEIEQARKQFGEYKEYCCSLVVFNIDDRQFRSDPLSIFGAMLGNLGMAMDFDSKRGEAIPGSERSVFGKSGKMIDYKGKRKQNTTISAIVVLEKFLDNFEVEKALKEEVKKRGKSFTGPEMIDARMKLYKNHHVMRVPRVVVVENPFARRVFPEDLFNGPFDEYWRWREDLNGKIERVFIGNKLKELEEIKGNS